MFTDGELRRNAIGSLRRIAGRIEVSEFNGSGGVRITRQLGKAVIDRLHGVT